MASITGWKWGDELPGDPLLYATPEPPKFYGEKIEQVSDLQTVPTGDYFEFSDSRIQYNGPELHLFVYANSSDRFTLYLEKSSSGTKGGLRLDTSRRCSQICKETLIFKHPQNENWEPMTITKLIPDFLKPSFIEEITDIRRAPGGASFELWNYVSYKGPDLHIWVEAAKSDQFSVYLEKSPLRNVGLYLDASARKVNELIQRHVLVLTHPKNENWKFVEIIKLLPVDPCPIPDDPEPIAVELALVEKIENVYKDQPKFPRLFWYFDADRNNFQIDSGIIANQKLNLFIKHHFSVRKFKLEYVPAPLPKLEYAEETITSSLLSENKHSRACACSRISKEWEWGELKIELAQLTMSERDTIDISGPTNEAWSPELITINIKNSLSS